MTFLALKMLKIRKNLHILLILVFTAMMSSTIFYQHAFAAVTEGCGFFEIRPDCDISGWIHLIIGEIMVGTFLAVFFHYLSERNSRKIESNAVQIQKVISEQENLRKARRNYAVQNIKTHLTTLLFVMGIITRLVATYNRETAQKSSIYTKVKEEEERVGRVLQTARNTITYASDTLDPAIVEQLEGLCTFIDQLSVIEKNGKMEFPKYNRSKEKIAAITEILQDYPTPSAGNE